MITSIRVGRGGAPNDSQRCGPRRARATPDGSSRRGGASGPDQGRTARLLGRAARLLGRALVARLLKALARLLHPVRRRAARSALSGPSPRSILVVCYGNICRSPLAAALLGRAFGAAGVPIGSAGFIASNRPAPRDAVTAAARRGVDLSGHRSRLLTADLVSAADLIVVMEPEQQRAVCERFGRWPRDVIVLGDLDPTPVEGRTIRDPIEQGPEVFEASYARIERCVRELSSVLTSASG